MANVDVTFPTDLISTAQMCSVWNRPMNGLDFFQYTGRNWGILDFIQYTG